MSTPAATTGRDSPKLRDDTTRFLCGAVHRDQEFADSAIREYLVEATRSIPRSPGVNAGAVLREAVAARARRKVRDSALLVLATLVLFAGSGTLLGLWLLVASGVAVATGVATGVRLQRRERPVSLRGPLALGSLAGAIALLFVLYKLSDELYGSSTDSAQFEEYEPGSGGGALTIVIISMVLIFVVLLADRDITWMLVTKSFRRAHFRTSEPEEGLWRNEWKIRQLGHSNYAEALALHPTDDSEPDDPDQAQVIVYDGYRPFVGSGTMFEPWSMALPLKPAEEETTPFTLPELYEHVTSELINTGRSPSLSPGHRLRDLKTGDRVVISAIELIDHIDDDEARIVLPDKDHSPETEAGKSLVDELIARPMEWMRYFRSFQVETWDRDVVVSAYLTFGLDDEMLYAEWTPCILYPVKAKYLEIDTLPEQSMRPFGDAIVDLLKFPVTVPKRFATAVDWMTPIYQAEGTFVPARYGARNSLRELASERQVANYFQLTDVERYVKVLESRLLRAMGEFLESRGISVTEFMEQAMQVTNNNVHITGPVISSNIATAGRARAGNTGKGKEKA